MFNSYEFNPHPSGPSSSQKIASQSQSQNAASQDDLIYENPCFEISLSTLIESLNVFGSGSGNAPALSEKGAKRGWKDRDRDNGSGDEGEDVGGGRSLWAGLGRGGDKVTTMKMVFEAPGEPVKLYM